MNLYFLFRTVHQAAPKLPIIHAVICLSLLSINTPSFPTAITPAKHYAWNGSAREPRINKKLSDLDRSKSNSKSELRTCGLRPRQRGAFHGAAIPKSSYEMELPGSRGGRVKKQFKGAEYWWVGAEYPSGISRLRSTGVSRSRDGGERWKERKEERILD